MVYFLTFRVLTKGLTNTSILNKGTTKKNITSISVIVSARNEQKNLPGLIECLAKQDTENLTLEYIIVDDRSEDDTGQIIREQSQKDRRFKYIHVQDQIAGFAPKKRAIDTAIKQANGEIILLTDADGRPGPNWVASIVNIFNDGADMVIGYAPYSVNEKSGVVRKMLALEYFSHAAIAAASTGLNYPLTCVGTNMAYLKSVYQQIGGFGEYKSFISGDDDLFLTRVRETRQFKIRYATHPDSQVWNAEPRSFIQFINQRLRYASKGFNYPVKVTLVLILYMLYNFLLFSVPLLGFFNPNYFLVAVMGLFFKMIIEYGFVKKAATLFQDTRFTNLYFLTSLLHIPYVLFFGIAGQLKIFKWAENKAEYAITKKMEAINE